MLIDILPQGDNCPINVKINIVPDSTIKCDLLLGRNFLWHPKVILNLDSGNSNVQILLRNT